MPNMRIAQKEKCGGEVAPNKQPTSHDPASLLLGSVAFDTDNLSKYGT